MPTICAAGSTLGLTSGATSSCQSVHRASVSATRSALTPELSMKDASAESGPTVRTLARCGLYSSRFLVRPRATIPDQRELVLSCARDMKLGTAIAHNLDGPATSADAGR